MTLHVRIEPLRLSRAAPWSPASAGKRHGRSWATYGAVARPVLDTEDNAWWTVAARFIIRGRQVGRQA